MQAGNEALGLPGITNCRLLEECLFSKCRFQPAPFLLNICQTSSFVKS